ncbi:MAG: hypothetical protein U9Q66_00090 [Patescibacteria group bacterium]|nr:hypothetical protein [Patescibacteria group bacterium]
MATQTDQLNLNFSVNSNDLLKLNTNHAFQSTTHTQTLILSITHHTASFKAIVVDIQAHLLSQVTIQIEIELILSVNFLYASLLLTNSYLASSGKVNNNLPTFS